MDKAGKAYHRRASIRSRLKKKYGAVTKQEVDDLERRYDLPKKYLVRFNNGRADNRQCRTRFLLYQACIKATATMWRRAGTHQSRENAGILEDYLDTLEDAAPRQTEFYEHEWKLITRALRPQGSNPTPGTPSARAYACYLWISRHKTIIEGEEL